MIDPKAPGTTSRTESEAIKKSIECLSREQESHETEIKLHRAILDGHEKRIELITTMNARRIQRLTDHLDRVSGRSAPAEHGQTAEPIDHDVREASELAASAVEKNERNMLVKIEDELRELNTDLIDCLLTRL